MSIYEFTVKASEGADLDLADYNGQVLLVVNTASKCGFTPQYKGLEALYKKYKDKGLEILGFPCNQFASQDPGTDSEILEFCQLNYGVTFPMMAKVDVNGSYASPLFRWLTSQAPGFLGSKRIKWNFTKFLVGRDGEVIARYGPNDEPAAIAADIKQALASNAAVA